jgi:hypothetical protein
VLDPSNLGLMEGALSSFISAGDMERAVPIATRIIQNLAHQPARQPRPDRARRAQGDWAALLTNLDAGQSVGPLFDGLAGPGRLSARGG